MVAFAFLVYLGMLLAVAVTAVLLRTRRHRTQTVVQTVALIVGQNVPLGPALRAAARYERRKLRTMLEHLAHRLEIGDTLSTALRSAYPTCPGHVVGTIQGAEQGGTLPGVLRTLAADLQRERTSVKRFSPAVLYFFALAIVVPAILLSIVVFLVPKFRDIYLDYGVSTLPAATEAMVSVADALIKGGPLFVLVFLGLALLCVQTLATRLFLPRVPDRFQLVPAVLDTIAWHLPLLRRITETRALARQLPILQAAIRAGHDVAPAARQAARTDANVHARRRMRCWAEQIERGAEPAARARALGFPPALRRALSTARNPDELSAALDYLCSYYRSLLAHWEHVLVSFAIPCVVLTWALCVGLAAYSVFAPVCVILDSIIADIW